MSCVFPVEGIQDNTVNRLLLMSSAENYLPSLPMAFFIQSTPTSEKSFHAQHNLKVKGRSSMAALHSASLCQRWTFQNSRQFHL
jgi:hypothetical protein